MIVIPMAGLSQRFFNAGYALPKYMLPLDNGSVFDHAVGSFRAYFETMPFLFVIRDVLGTREFVEASCTSLGLQNAEIVVLSAATAGQAETVELALDRSGAPENTPLTIFNIDTFRPGFRYPTAAWWPSSDGYLETFRGSGANWSYVRPSPDASSHVLETAEKQPISDLCCTGLYHFERARDFRMALAHERAKPTVSELYVAPIYNHLIRNGARIHFEIIPSDSVVFCGVPAEYEALLKEGRVGADRAPAFPFENKTAANP